MSELSKNQNEGLARLLQFEQQLRGSESTDNLNYLLTNNLYKLIPYRQAALWRIENRSIASLSGVPIPQQDAPYAQWLRHLARHCRSRYGVKTSVVTALDLPEDLAKDWASWMPAHVAWIPLKDPSNEKLEGELLLGRDAMFADHELRLLDRVSQCAGHSMALQRLKGSTSRWRGFAKNFSRKWLLLGLIAGGLWLPVTQSTVSPASIVAKSPMVVRAPLAGVVDQILVNPNQPVVAGTPLLRLDATEINNKIALEIRALEVITAEYQQQKQLAFNDPQSNARALLLQGRLEQKKEEVKYLQSLLERVDIVAQQDGIVLLEETSGWIGRPVRLGERLLEVARPDQIELELRLPVASLIKLPPQAKVKMFLDIAPESPLDAQLYQIGYQPELMPEGYLAYPLRAEINEIPKIAKIGFSGTAKIYGEKVSLFSYLFRRPVTSLRQWLGI